MKTNLSNIVRAGSACPLFTAAALALAITLTLTLTSCGKKEGGNVKLLESITNYYGDVEKKFEYDDKNRLVKMIEYRLDGDGKASDSSTTTTTITYNSDDLVTVVRLGVNGADTTKFVKNGNTIIEGGYTITIDKDGYIVKKNDCTYQYRDSVQTDKGYNNFLDIKCDNNIIGYMYDRQKSPFFNSSTPKWLLQYKFIRFDLFNAYDNYPYGTKNNILYARYSPGSGLSEYQRYEYEYDSEGFAVKQTLAEGIAEGATTSYEIGGEVTYFVYRGRTAEEKAAFDSVWQAAKKERLANKAKTDAEKAEVEAKMKTAAEYAKAKREKAIKAGQTFTDKRDGKIYRFVKIGEQTWMAENLNYEGAGKCPIGYECLLGRLYFWAEENVCPEGYHLPNNDEWDALIAYVEKDKGCKDCAGKHLKAAGGWVDDEGKPRNGLDSYGFSALPGGGCSWQESGDEFCYGLSFTGVWLSAPDGYYFMHDVNDVVESEDGSGIASLCSIRCIKDEDKTSAPETDQTTINNEAAQ